METAIRYHSNAIHVGNQKSHNRENNKEYWKLWNCNVLIIINEEEKYTHTHCYLFIPFSPLSIFPNIDSLNSGPILLVRHWLFWAHIRKLSSNNTSFDF